jgi:hypothetical protein
MFRLKDDEDPKKSRWVITSKEKGDEIVNQPGWYKIGND